MNIIPLRQVKNEFFLDLSTGDSNRKIGCYLLSNVVFCGRNLHYPNLLMKSKEKLISPYDERVMSLQCDSFYKDNLYEGPLGQSLSIIDNPCFFFALNVDNYFHFIYDTIPYLYYYLELRKQVTGLRLLLQTSHPTKKTLPLFVLETLDLLGIKGFELLSKDTEYKQVYFGLSLTHGGQSNAPPHPFSSTVWKALVIASCTRIGDSVNPIDRFYVSRRSWLSKHPENIGTNYTTRRKCMNEDSLVDFLQEEGFKEIFCEDLSMAEKIFYFSKAKEIVGVIGGGMCNCLFSPSTVYVHCLVTEGFLDINYRFRFSMDHTSPSYYLCCPLAPFQGNYSLYTRAKVQQNTSEYNDRVGELESYRDGFYTLKISKDGVAGFSQDFAFEVVEIHQENLLPLDKGLNSPYLCNMERFKQSFRNL